MKKLFACILFLACSVYGRAQFLAGIMAPAPITLLGETQNNESAAGGLGIQFFTEATTGATTYNVLGCSIQFAAHGTAGDQIECGLYSANGANPGSVLCHAAYTETGTEASQTIFIPLSGCGTLAASTNYWVFQNTNDAAYPVTAYNCGGSCTGTYPAATTPTFDAVQSYGTYAVNPTPGSAGSRLSTFVSIQ